MREVDIRKALVAYLDALHAQDEETLVIEEVGVCQGASRVDLAVVNGSLHGFEIKSDQDTLTRLPGQLRDYGSVFDGVTLVVGERHIEKLLKQVPDWCGVILVTDGTLAEVRPSGDNPNRDPYALAQLLWKEEALEVLSRHGLVKGVKSKPRTALWRRLSENLSLEELATEVRLALKNRKSKWITDSRLLRDDGKAPLSATS